MHHSRKSDDWARSVPIEIKKTSKMGKHQRAPARLISWQAALNSLKKDEKGGIFEMEEKKVGGRDNAGEARHGKENHLTWAPHKGTIIYLTEQRRGRT